MTKRIIVFTLGFDATAVLARITEIALQGDEEFVFLVPTKATERSENTILTIQQFINSLNTRGLKIIYEFIRVNENSVSDATQTTYDKLSTKNGSFIFDLSGGLRALVIIGYIVAQLLRNRVHEVSSRLESSNEKVIIPLFDLTRPTQAEIRILDKIDRNKELTQKEIAEDIDRKVSSVARVLMDLEAKGFVIKSNGKPSRYALTKIGSLILKSSSELKHC